MAQGRAAHIGASRPGWTDERVEALKSACDEGLSASQIAARLGAGVTRNAVIGKAARMGLTLRGEATSMKHRIEARRAPRAPRPERRVSMEALRAKAPARPRAVKPARPPVSQFPTLKEEPFRPREATQTAMRLIPLMALGWGDCRWPVDEAVPGRAETTRFCGAPCGDRVYCAAHAAIAFSGTMKKPDLAKMARWFR